MFYGEDASGTSPPADTALTGSTYSYNGAYGKVTNTASGITHMGARPYQASTGRFTQPDPIQGGCANQYTYAFGDPLSNPDLTGEGGCHKKKHCFLGLCAGTLDIIGAVASAVAVFVPPVGLIAVAASSVAAVENAEDGNTLGAVLDVAGAAIGAGSLAFHFAGLADAANESQSANGFGYLSKMFGQAAEEDRAASDGYARAGLGVAGGSLTASYLIGGGHC